MTTILVLGRPMHDIPASEYATALRERLPGVTVHYPKTTAGTLDTATDATIITSTSLPDEVLDAADELRPFARATAGCDHLPLETPRERGVRVTNASDVHGPNIAERVIGWLLMIIRRLNEGLRHQRRHK